MAAKGPQTVEAYLAGLEPHAAHIVEQVREAMRGVAADLEESISYGMPKFTYAGTYLYAGAWKAHIGLYPVFPVADPDLEAAIAPYRSGKDTVKFRYTKPIPYELIARIARARIGAG